MKLTDFSGATRIPLIGRRALLQDTERRIRQGGPHLLYVEGQGGIGKTAVLEAILERSQESAAGQRCPATYIAEEVIDLYHVDVHTPEGLMQRIMQVLAPQRFTRTRGLIEALDQARSAGNMDAANEKARALRQEFLAEFASLAQRGIVLAFDTTEVLEYERDPFQMELGEDVAILSAGEWLFKSFIPALEGNVLLLLAGRPNGIARRLDAVRKRNPSLQLRYTHLEALSQDETQEYLKTIARVEGERGNEDAAARLWSFSEQRSDIVHFLTGGRPILLALIADMVAHGWTLPPPFGRNLKELQQREAESWWPEIEQALVIRIQESPTPISDTIRALAWLRKGATAAQLTLVKVRPNEGRVFLHDEMHTLLEKYVLRQCSEEERDRVYGAILHYYDRLIGELEQRVAQSPFPSPFTHARLRHAQAENMHYRLCHRPSQGFAMFFWLAEEALTSHDTEMDMLLRSELLRTVSLLHGRGSLAGLNLLEVKIDTAVRWGVRMLYLHNDPDGALQVFAKIQERWGTEIEELDLTRAHLQLYLAAARIERAQEGDWPKARLLLNFVERQADELLTDPSAPATTRALFGWAREPEEASITLPADDRCWGARTLKAAALSLQGYLDRQQGRYAAAVQHYQAATRLQRRLSMASLAPTLTDLSHTMVLMGQFHHARLLAQEAERWARRSGKAYILAQVLNTRALLEEYDGRPADALEYSEQALKIAEGLRALRLRGLIYLTRARAHRHLFLSGEEQDRQARTLDDALKEANQAVNLLKNTPPERVTALIERGCMHREIARVHYLQQKAAEVVKAARKSQQDLERAALLAGALNLPDQQVLAWTNLGWLWYYTGQIEEAHEALRQTYAAIPADYIFPERGSLPPIVEQERKREASLPFWSTLGKAEMLKAHIALDQAQTAPEKEEQGTKLREAAGHLTLSLAYDGQIADDYFVTRAEEGLHKRILEDNLDVSQLHHYAQQVAEEQSLGQPTRFQQFLTRMFGPGDLWA